MDFDNNSNYVGNSQPQTGPVPTPAPSGGQRKRQVRGMSYKDGQQALKPSGGSAPGAGGLAPNQGQSPGAPAGDGAQGFDPTSEGIEGIGEGPLDVDFLEATEIPAGEAGSGAGEDEWNLDELETELAGPIGETEVLRTESDVVQQELQAPAAEQATINYGEIADEFAGEEFMSPEAGGDVLGDLVPLENSTTQLQTTTQAEHQAYIDSEKDIIADAIGLMNSEEKGMLLGMMGFEDETIAGMSAGEIDQALQGNMEQSFRYYRIMGMSWNELRTLPYAERVLFIQGLGVPEEELKKAKPSNINKAFDKILRLSKIPGHHKVNLRISGNFLWGRTYDIKFEVTEEGMGSVDVERKGGFFQWLGSLIKKAFPYIMMILGPLTFGITNLIMGVIGFIQGIKNGDWLGAIISLTGGIASLPFKALETVARIAEGINGVTRSIQGVLIAWAARSPGGFLAALANGAAATIGILGDGAGEFSKTLQTWVDNFEQWSGLALGAEAFISAVKDGDGLGAVSAALQTAIDVSDVCDGDAEGGLTDDLKLTQQYFTYARIAHAAIGTQPPRYADFIGSVLGMVGELTDNGRIEAAGNLAGYVQVLQDSVEAKDPLAIINALLDVAKGIEQVHEGDPGAGTFVGGIQRYTTPALTISEGLRDRNWALVATTASAFATTLTDNEWVEDADEMTNLVIDLNLGIRSGDPMAIFNAGRGIWNVVDRVLTREGENVPAPEGTESESPANPTHAPGMTGLQCTPTVSSTDQLQFNVAMNRTEISQNSSTNNVERRAAGEPDREAVATELARIPMPGLKKLKDMPVSVEVCVYDVTDAYPSLARATPTGHEHKGSISSNLAEWYDAPGGPARTAAHHTGVDGLTAGTKIHVDDDSVTDWLGIIVDEPNTQGLAGQRGWIKKADFVVTTWKGVPGAYVRPNVVVATRNGRVPEKGDGHGSDNLVIHETGHAIGHQLASSPNDKRGYEDEAFLAARRTDYDALSDYEKDTNVDGFQETYAESMARFLVHDHVDGCLFPKLSEYWRDNALFKEQDGD